MTRVRLRLLAASGAGVALALAAVVIWLDATPGVRAPSTQPTAQTGSIGSDFTPLAKPRPLPELRFTNADGRDLAIADFRGRLILLNLWATWCVPCRKEMPTLDRLEAKLGGPDFEVVALSIDRQGLAAVQPFFKELGLKALRVYLDPSGKAAFALNAPGLPTTLLIDQEGREVGRKIGPAEWDSPEIEHVIRRYLSRKGAADIDSIALPGKRLVQSADVSGSDHLQSSSANVHHTNADEVTK